MSLCLSLSKTLTFLVAAAGKNRRLRTLLRRLGRHALPSQGEDWTKGLLGVLQVLRVLRVLRVLLVLRVLHVLPVLRALYVLCV